MKLRQSSSASSRRAQAKTWAVAFELWNTICSYSLGACRFAIGGGKHMPGPTPAPAGPDVPTQPHPVPKPSEPPAIPPDVNPPPPGAVPEQPALPYPVNPPQVPPPEPTVPPAYG